MAPYNLFGTKKKARVLPQSPIVIKRKSKRSLGKTMKKVYRRGLLGNATDLVKWSRKNPMQALALFGGVFAGYRLIRNKVSQLLNLGVTFMKILYKLPKKFAPEKCTMVEGWIGKLMDWCAQNSYVGIVKKTYNRLKLLRLQLTNNVSEYTLRLTVNKIAQYYNALVFWAYGATTSIGDYSADDFDFDKAVDAANVPRHIIMNAEMFGASKANLQKRIRETTHEIRIVELRMKEVSVDGSIGKLDKEGNFTEADNATEAMREGSVFKPDDVDLIDRDLRERKAAALAVAQRRAEAAEAAKAKEE